MPVHIVSSLHHQIADMESAMGRLAQRVPDLPLAEMLTSRLLALVGRELLSRFDQSLRPYGLNEIEFRTLMVVYSSPDMETSPGDLCGILAQSPANITRVTDVLVDRGFVLRLPDAQDRRRLVLQITSQGEALLTQFLPTLAGVARSSYREFPVEELQQLQASLRKLAAAMDRTREPATPPASQSEGTSI